MARNEEPTTRFKADISELKSAMQQATRDIRLANAEFKAASSGMDDWSSSADGISAKLKQLNTVLDAEERKLAALQEQHRLVVQEQGENSKGAQELAIKIANQQAAVNKTAREIRNYEDRLSAVERSSTDAAEEAERLREEFQRVSREFGESSDEAQDVKRQLDEVEASLQDTDDAADNLEESTSSLSDGFSVLKGAVATFAGNMLSEGVGAIKDGITSMLDLAEATREYRGEMAKLNSSAESNGYSADYAKEKYTELYGVLADETAANTTVSNFMAMHASAENLDSLINSSIGLWAKYGDSIPLDGLAEAVNETSKVGTVTGGLADALNWGAASNETFGVSLKANTKANEEWNKAVEEAASAEDFFNLALQECSTEQERQQLIVDTLDGMYGDLSTSYQETNQSVIDANKANIDYQDTMADLGKKVEPITMSINKGLQKLAKRGIELTEDIDWKKFEKKVDSAFDTFGDALEWVIENADMLIDILKSLVGGFAAMKAATAAGKAISTVTTAIQGTTSAMGALSSLMKANPIGAIATAVGLLATGYIALSEATEKQFEATENEIVSAQNSLETATDKIQSLEDTAAAYDELKEAQAESVSQDLAQIDNAKLLADNLDELVDANGRVKEGEESRAEFILGKLNEALGTEYDMTDGIITNYQDLKTEIYALIEAKKAEILLAAQEDVYKQAILNKTQAQKDLADATIALQQTEQSIADARTVHAEDLQRIQELEQNGVSNTTQQWTELSNLKMSSWYQELTSLETTLAEQQAKYDEANVKVDQYYKDISGYEQASTLVLQGETRKAIELLQQQNSAFQTASSTAGYSATEQKRILGEQYASALISLDQYNKKLKDGVEGYNEEELTALKERAEQAKIEAETAGVNMVDGTIEGIDGEKIDLKNTIKSLTESGSEVLSDSVSDYELLGKDMGTGVGDGIASTISYAQNKMRKLVNDIIVAGRAEADSHSPSRKTIDLGEDIDEGLIVGLENLRKKVEEAGQNVVIGAIPNVGTVKAAISNGVSRLRGGLDQETSHMGQGNSTHNTGQRAIVFNQYNTSPKALSRLEIYRQTRNQLRMLRGIV